MVVGLTGGIGCGKSTVARIFGLFGAVVFNSDEEAKNVYLEPKIKQRIVALLGKESYDEKGHLNKVFISSKVFSDTLLLHQLNTIIHPAVKEKMQSFVSANAGKTIIKESALIFEAQLEKEVDKIIVVASDEKLRIKRVMLRDGLSEADVLLRISKQLSQEEKIKRTDFIIHNNEIELIIPQVKKIYDQLH